jgi:hypothetical protein
MSLSLSNLRSLTYNSTTNIATFSGSVVIASNLGINVATPSYTLVIGGDFYTSASILAPNVVYQFLQGAGSAPDKQYNGANQVFGKNYDSGTTGYLTPYESVGLSNTVGSGWVDGNWYAPKTGKYLVDIFMFFSRTTVGNRWMLNVYNSSTVFKYFQYIYVEMETDSASQTTHNYFTVLNMNQGDYFNITLYSYAGLTTIYYGGTAHSRIKINQIA